jgi:CheY-like chemotaxis protein
MKTIMVIDDDQQIRELVELSLKITSGWKVIEATSGQHAVERLREVRPDAILLDFHMPDLNGLDTLKLIRETPEYRDIPVIAYTARRLVRSLAQAVRPRLVGQAHLRPAVGWPQAAGRCGER